MARTSGEVQVVSAGLPRTCSPERLAEFLRRCEGGRRKAGLAYPAGYLRWLAGLSGHDPYLNVAMIDEGRQIVGAALSRPLTLGIWSNMKLRAAIREAASEGRRDRSARGWVRYLTRDKDADLAAALANLLPEEHYALRAAAIEFLQVDPARPGEGHERVLLDVALTEARAAGYDYLLCWGEALPLPPGRATRVAAVEAVVELLPAQDAGLLRLYNAARRLARAARRWLQAEAVVLRRRYRRARARLRALPGLARRALRGWPGDGATAEPRPSAVSGGLPLTAPGTAGAMDDGVAGAGVHPPPPTPSPTTLDGVRILCLGTPDLPLDDELAGQLLALIGEAQERHGIFPTYDAARLRELLTPARPGRRSTAAYAAHRERRAPILGADESHDVLSYVAQKGERFLALVFGHRLPWLDPSGEAEETWAIRAVYFGPGPGVLARADILQRCVEAAAAQCGIRRALLLRPAGLAGYFLTQRVLGARALGDRLALHYVPLSESALAEVAVLERRLPVEYI